MMFKEIDWIYSPESIQEIRAMVRQLFGEQLSEQHVEAWTQMILEEAEPKSYIDYSIDQNSEGGLYFHQYGKKEYYHDGSCEPRKFISILPIDEEAYNKAKARQCVPETISNNYEKNWLGRGEENFLTYWRGRSFDYVYYAKNIAGLSYVKIEIEYRY